MLLRHSLCSKDQQRTSQLHPMFFVVSKNPVRTARQCSVMLSAETGQSHTNRYSGFRCPTSFPVSMPRASRFARLPCGLRSCGDPETLGRGPEYVHGIAFRASRTERGRIMAVARHEPDARPARDAPEHIPRDCADALPGQCVPGTEAHSAQSPSAQRPADDPGSFE